MGQAIQGPIKMQEIYKSPFSFVIAIDDVVVTKYDKILEFMINYRWGWHYETWQLLFGN